MKLLSSTLFSFLIFSLATPVWSQAQNPDSFLQPNASSPLRIQILEEAGPAQVRSLQQKKFVFQVIDTAGKPVSDAALAFRLPETGPTGRLADGSRGLVVYTDLAGKAEIAGVHWGETAGLAELRVTAAKGTLHSGILVQQVITDSISVQGDALPPPARPSVTHAVVQLPPAEPGSPAQLPTREVAQPRQVVATGASSAEPAISIVNTPSGVNSRGGVNKKWLILAAVGVGVGVAVAMAMGGHGGAAATTSTAAATASTLSIGSPQVSVGHP